MNLEELKNQINLLTQNWSSMMGPYLFALEEHELADKEIHQTSEADLWASEVNDSDVIKDRQIPHEVVDELFNNNNNNFILNFVFYLNKIVRNADLLSFHSQMYLIHMNCSECVKVRYFGVEIARARVHGSALSSLVLVWDCYSGMP